MGAGRDRSLSPRRRILKVLAGILALLVVCPAPPALATAGEDEAALRRLVEQCCATYAKKDLEGAIALWSAKSPEFAPRRQAMVQLFKIYDRMEVPRYEVRRVALGERPSIRVAVDIAGVEAGSGKPDASV